MAESLFGPTPDAVRRAMADERLSRASLIGSLGPGGHGALAGGLLGQGIKGLFGGEDPRLKQAQDLQQIGQEMEQAGLEPSSPGFAREVYKRMVGRGFPQPVALQAFEAASQAEQQALEVQSIRGGPGAQQAQIERRIKTLMSLDVPESQAIGIAQNDKAYAKVVGDLATRQERGTTDFQNFQAAQQDPEFAQFLSDQKPEGASVRVENYFSKPLGTDAADWRTPDGAPADPNQTASEAAATGARPITKEAQAAATEVSKLQVKRAEALKRAKPALDTFADLARNPQASADYAARLSTAYKSAGQALARFRNPERVTDDDVKQAQKSLPSIPSILGGLAGSQIETLENETGIKWGGGGGSRVRRFNPQTGKLEP